MIPAVEYTDGTSASAGGSAIEQSVPAGAASPSGEHESFLSRGRARRRLRYLHKARELAYRDLGGLVFNLHRFGQRNDALVLAKLATLDQIDRELRALEGALHEHRPLSVLREAGISACPRCAAIHSSEDRFCPHCGLSLGPHAEIPAGIGTAAAPREPVPLAEPAPSQQSQTQSAPATAPSDQPSADTPPGFTDAGQAEAGLATPLPVQAGGAPEPQPEQPEQQTAQKEPQDTTTRKRRGSTAAPAGGGRAPTPPAGRDAPSETGAAEGTGAGTADHTEESGGPVVDDGPAEDEGEQTVVIRPSAPSP